MNRKRGNVLFLLDMSLEEGNSAPSVHLMNGIVSSVAEVAQLVHVITRLYEGPDCLDFADTKSKNYIIHKKIDVALPGKVNVVKRFMNDYTYFREAYKYLRTLEDVDSIFIQSCVNPAAAIYYARKAFPTARITYNVQDIYSEAAICRGIVTRRSPLYRAFLHLERIAYNRADQIITVSEGMAQTIENTGCDKGKIAVIHNWSYDDNPIVIPDSANAFMKEHKLDDSKFKVVYAGNIGALQDVETLIDAATILRENSNIEFVIVGDGVRAEVVRTLVEVRNLQNIHLFPRQSSEVVAQIYSMANLNVITLMPGMTKAALPSKTAICLACGKPILLSTDTDSIYAQRMTETHNCFLCEPKNAPAMAKTISQAYETRDASCAEGSYALFNELFCGSINRTKYRDIILRFD